MVKSVFFPIFSWLLRSSPGLSKDGQALRLPRCGAPGQRQKRRGAALRGRAWHYARLGGAVLGGEPGLRELCETTEGFFAIFFWGVGGMRFMGWEINDV